jgi:hypothetical protein
MPDIIYMRPAGRKQYTSISKHQSNADNRWNKWINMNIERDLFDFADYGNFNKIPNGNLSWVSHDTNMWSLEQDRSNVGTAKQQFGFFQHPVNATDPWHGFPMTPFSKGRYIISDDLLMRWVSDGVINVDDIPNIMNKKRI